MREAFNRPETESANSEELSACTNVNPCGMLNPAAMKNLGFAVRWKAVVTGCFLLTMTAADAAFYRAGDVVTNFLVHCRPSWTNSMGLSSNAPIRLSDFAGKILFIDFFDPT